MYLDTNVLTELPDGLFSGLTNLNSVRVDGQRDTEGNAIASLPLTMMVQESGIGMAVVEIPQGVPFTSVTATLSITGGTFTDATTTVTIAKGETRSAEFAFTLAEPTVDTPMPEATISITATSSDPMNILDDTQGYSGFTLAAGPALTSRLGICNRTQQVQEGILAAISVDTPDITCDRVTNDDLAEITFLTLSNRNISSLQTGDFAGLANLTHLNLNDNLLTDLFPPIFADLLNLTNLNLSQNQLTILRSDIVAPLANLATLNLFNNQLTTLRPDVFAPLTNLTTLFLNNNQLTELPPTIFSDLGTLQLLFLNDNQLTELPPAIFSGLTNLTTLDASGNTTDPFTLDVTLKEIRAGVGAIEVVQGVPFQVTATVSITGGTFADGTRETSLTLSKGDTQSSFSFIVDQPTATTLVPEATITLTQIATTPPNILDGLIGFTGYNGFELAAGPDLTRQMGICNRTQQVQDEILQQINSMPGLSAIACSTVTDAHLTEITELDLSGQSIASLQSRDFADLTALTSLNLSNNQLTNSALPADIFSGLTALETLLLNNNALSMLPGGIFSDLTSLTGVRIDENLSSPMPLNLSLKEISPGMAVVEVAQGVPFASVTASLFITGGTFSDSSDTTSVTLSTGETQSAPFAFNVNPPTEDILMPEATIRITSTSSDPTNVFDGFDEINSIGYNGFTLLAFTAELTRQMGICSRTPQVRDALLAAITQTNDCAMVTAAQLATITELDLSGETITTLQAGDFAGLSGLLTLNLSDNTLSSLEEPVFSPLSAVTNLNLSGNMFSSLDTSLTTLTTLDALTTLHLSNNQLTDLPENFFTGLPSLEGVDLSNNPDATSPMDIALTITPREIEIIPDDERQFNDPYQFVIEILQGAPVNITITVSVTAGGTFSDNRMTATNVTILKGMRESERIEITPDIGHTEITLTPASTTSLSSFVANTGAGYSGLAIVGETWTRQVGICSRSEPIQRAILFAIPDAQMPHPPVPDDSMPDPDDPMSDPDEPMFDPEDLMNFCSDVTREQLAAVTSLPLDNEDINELLPGDLAGLSGLTSLDLSDLGLSSLPDDVFSDLDALTILDLSDNELTSVNTLFFPNMLTELDLSGNALRNLTSNIFSILTALTTLDLSDNELTDLPIGFFSGLVALAGADLSGNPASRTPGPFTLTLTPRELRTPNMFVIEVTEGAPTELTATVQIRGGTLVNGATEMEVTLSAGMTRSAPIEFVMPAEEPTTVILVADSASDPSNLLNGYSLPGVPIGTGYSGLELDEGEPLVFGNGICDRTPRVQAAILNEINRRSGLIGTEIAEDDCRVVVNADLAAITELDVDPTPSDNTATLSSGDFAGLVNMRFLDLENNQLSEVPADIFSGLESLRAVDLSDNALTDLPNEFFSGLTALEGADFSDNPGADFTLTLTLQITEVQNQFVVEVAQGAPTDLIASVTISGGTLSYDAIAGATSVEVTLAAGRTESTLITVTPNPNDSVALRVMNATPSFAAFNTNTRTGYSGLTIEATEQTFRLGICSRTQQVQDAILDQISQVNDCAAVTLAQLAAITELDLSDPTQNPVSPDEVNNDRDERDDITELTSADFAGLTELTALDLRFNRLTTLPADIFNGLAKLQILTLSNNRLTTSGLLAGVFSDLIALEYLDLENNAFTTLPAGIFNGLRNNLKILLLGNELGDEKLEQLPNGIFSNLTELRALNLCYNELTALPSGINGMNLPNLRALILCHNNLEALPNGIFSDLTNLIGVRVDGNSEDPLPLTLRLQESSDGMAAIQVAQGVPFTSITATVSITGGTFDEPNPGPGVTRINNTQLQVTLTTGQTQSSAFGFTVDQDHIAPVIMLSNPASEPQNIVDGFITAVNPDLVPIPLIRQILTVIDITMAVSGYSGFQLVSDPELFVGAGICNRTPQVQAAILEEIGRGVMCNAVTDAQLERVMTLDLSTDNISTLQLGDFAALTNLMELNLSGNTLSTLPSGIFSNLRNLERLFLNNNQFTELPNGIFSDLTNLTGVRDVSGQFRTDRRLP